MMETKKECLRHCEWCMNYRDLSREGEYHRVRAYCHGCGVKGLYVGPVEPFDYAKNCDSYVFDRKHANKRMESLGRSIEMMKNAMKSFEAERDALMSLLQIEEAPADEEADASGGKGLKTVGADGFEEKEESEE